MGECNPPDFYAETPRRARKSRRCDECRSEIAAGERYCALFGVWYGDPESYSLCTPCHDAHSAYYALTGCCAWFGGLLEEIEEYCAGVPVRSADDLPPPLAAFARKLDLKRFRRPLLAGA